MNRIGKLLVGVALAAGVTLGTSGVSWASDVPIEANPCPGGVGAEGQVGHIPFYACVYPWPSGS